MVAFEYFAICNGTTNVKTYLPICQFTVILQATD